MNTSSNKAVSVVVVTYERRQHLRWCLEALALQTLVHERFEVVVVDDGGTDNSGFEVGAARRRHPGFDVRYSWHEHQGWGLARSRNDGAVLTTGECIVFIDSDILLNPEAASVYARLLQTNPKRVIGGYYKYLKGMEITLEAIKEWTPIWDMTLPELAIPQHEYQLLGTDVREAHYNQGTAAEDLFANEGKVYRNPYSLLGGNIMVPRDIWDRTEGFDETLTHYGGEDAEYSLQVADLGYGFSYSKRAGGCHMAHTKHEGAELKTEMAKQHIRERWPQWFTKHGEPIWAYAGWQKPRSGRKGAA